MVHLQTFLERLPSDYQSLLSPRLKDPKWVHLLEHLQEQEELARSNYSDSIFPKYDRVFFALAATPINSIKVILLGQDPYHSPGLAQGLAFSIPDHILPGSNFFPSSLRNINKALTLEGFAPLQKGDLSHWASQGVLLLNSCLTVQSGLPNSHVAWGWNTFTDALLHDVLSVLNGTVVMLWGGFAQKKEALIPADRNHLVLKASHPSGLGVYKTLSPFLMPKDSGSCEHFTLTNSWLNQHHKDSITW